MFRFGRRREAAGRSIPVGWVIDPNREASIIWDAPHKPTRPDGDTGTSKGLSQWAAIRDHESRLFEVSCPIDIRLRFYRDNQGNPSMIAIDGEQSTIRPAQFGQMVMAVHPGEWRHPARPLIQVMTPLFFIADEPVWLTQWPAFHHFSTTPLPGTMLGGRFPVHLWPRELVWAFEWHNTSRDLLIRRGEPWFYVSFETEHPARPVRLIEAELTPALREYTDAIRGVTNYVGRTFSLFGAAKARRPAKLLTAKVR
jgi:hypothetical protein